ncbi:UNVERIFIED_CONTAM: hypothetical protein GTU68_004363 [Idotea baltica]|nr:hypothetical protein [Idotea baltica]
MKKATVLIYGRVQGVGFRYWTLKTAKDLHLTGNVKNLSDGRVEAVFEGDEDTINHMLTKVKKGPAMANVYNMEVELEAASGYFDDFVIL